VYRRGEIYMRFLHRVSSVAFGTTVGRLLMLYLILPFGLATILMLAPGLLVEEGEKLGQMVGLVEKPPKVQAQPAPSHVDAEPPADPDDHPFDDQAAEQPPRAETPPKAQPASPANQPADAGAGADAKHHRRRHHGLEMPNLWGVAGLGIFFLLLFHVGEFRSGFFYGASRLARGLQTVFIHGPAWVLHQPALQALLHNRMWVLFRRFVFWPVVTAATAGLAAWEYAFDGVTIAGAALAGFLLGVLLLNTRVGRDLEESVTDLLVRLWLWLTVEFVPGLLRFIMDMSRWCLEAVEQVLYTVDEWLRFKSGESSFTLAAKAVLSVVWFVVTYVIRI